MDDLSTWLLARYDEHEQRASETGTIHTRGCRIWRRLYESTAATCDCGVPAFIRADVSAKRQIIELHKSVETSAGYSTSKYWPKHAIGQTVCVCEVCANNDNETGWDDSDGYPCATLRLLALPYADRPGYQESWRP